MLKAEKVVKFYALCNRLKNVVRSGWKVWHVKRERLESVAEHVYGGADVGDCDVVGIWL